MNKQEYSGKYDICIIGGGASGMAAAIAAKLDRPGLRILVAEKNAELGRKLRATGNGRCNLTNTEAAGYTRTLAFFRKLGIATRVYPNGLVYPHSESARDVAELLAAAMERLGVDVSLNTSVKSVKEVSDGFVIASDVRGDDGISTEMQITAGSVLVAAGGKAGPTFGTTGDGYRLAASLGHSIVTPIPVLTPVECAGQGCEKLSGIRARGRVTLYERGSEGRTEETAVFEEEGEIQFTRTGLSGICIFNMTRLMRFDRQEGIGVFSTSVDLCADTDIDGFLEDRRREAREMHSDERAGTLLRTVLKDALAAYVIERSGVDPEKRIADMSDSDAAGISGTARALRFSPTAVKGWKDAQCTSGGVALDEINDETCESVIVPGLYISGETADHDGPCGGFNLNNAWLTGIAAGRSMAERAEN